MLWLYIGMTSLAVGSTDAFPGGPDCTPHSYDSGGITMAALGATDCVCNKTDNNPPWGQLCQRGTYCAIWIGSYGGQGTCRVVRKDPPTGSPDSCSLVAKCPSDWYCAESWENTPVSIPVTKDSTGGICRHNSELAEHLQSETESRVCNDTTKIAGFCERDVKGGGYCTPTDQDRYRMVTYCLKTCGRCVQFEELKPITYSTVDDNAAATTTTTVDDNAAATTTTTTKTITTKTTTTKSAAENPENPEAVSTTTNKRAFQTLVFVTEPTTTLAKKKDEENSADTTKQGVWRVIYIACVAIGFVTM